MKPLIKYLPFILIVALPSCGMEKKPDFAKTFFDGTYKLYVYPNVSSSIREHLSETDEKSSQYNDIAMTLYKGASLSKTLKDDLWKVDNFLWKDGIYETRLTMEYYFALDSLESIIISFYFYPNDSIYIVDSRIEHCLMLKDNQGVYYQEAQSLHEAYWESLPRINN